MNKFLSPITLFKCAASKKRIPISLIGTVPPVRFMARRRASKVTALLAVVGLCGLATMLTESAQAVTFTVFTDPHPVVSGGTIGFAYAENKFVGSVEGDGPNLLYSTDVNGGSVALFAPGVSLDASPAGEHFVASSLGVYACPCSSHQVIASTIIAATRSGTNISENG